MDALLGRHYISLFLVLFFAVRLSSQQSTRDKGLRYFWITVVCCFLLILEDFAETITSEDPNLIFWRTLLSIAGYFLRSAASAALLLAVLKPEHRSPKVWIPCWIVLLICSTAFFTDIAFGFDAKYKFYRGPLGYVAFVVPITYLGAILWVTFRRYGDSDQDVDRVILAMCAFFCLLSAALDALMGGVRLHEAMLISSIFFYLFLRSYDIRKDSLTQLLNRQSMYYDLASMKKISAIASLDMNGLKTLNDTRGHHAGDEALRKIGECILAETSRSIRGYRIGGDEFAILFDQTEEPKVQETLSRVQKAAEAAGIHVACGYAMREKGEKPDSLLQRSDLKMFENKARFYREKGNDRRHDGNRQRMLFPDAGEMGIENLPEPIAVYQFRDHTVKPLSVSAGFRALFGYENMREPLHVTDPVLLTGVHGDDHESYSGAMMRFSEGTEELDTVFRFRGNPEAGWRMIHVRGKHIRGGDGSRIAYLWFMDEGLYSEEEETGGNHVSRLLNRALHEESILHAARYDRLTGLPNLNWFFQLSEAGKKQILDGEGQAALLYLDFNGMKYFNHRLGYAEGDRLLKAFAEELVCLFGRENCCHITADRFAAVTEEEGLEDRLHQLFEAARRMNDGKNLPVLVGVYPNSFEDLPVSAAYDRAKIACDAVLKTSVSGFRFYSMEMRDTVRRQQYVIANLDRAIAEKWIQVYYQPIVRSANERVSDEEALARWIDPTEGFLSPDDFIPQLEKTGLIYRLDLYVLDQVLEKIHLLQREGLNIVPHSINLSRSDFDVCDIVEEIRKRVDDAGVPRDRITIEITESVIGRNFDFMKRQVARFQELGFAVWMDDFGSGYSSLDVLQSIRFDLIKFDMSFLRKLDEGDSGKIILTEMMKMASSLNMGTVCEGVETEAHVRFLQEIGCSKLQGYYFCKPIPLDQILERYREGRQIGFEDTGASSYFETIGRVNLYDLGLIVSPEENSVMHAFSTVPMAVLEIQGRSARYVRSNPSYREFMNQFFRIDISNNTHEFIHFSSHFMEHVFQECCEQDGRCFFDEKMADGSVVHSLGRRIGVNPVNGNIAVAVAVLSVSEPDT